MLRSAIVVGISVATGSVVMAGPVATTKADLDGDNTADAIELAADGALSIGGKLAVRLATQTSATAKLSVATPKSGPLVVVELAKEAIVVGRAGAAWSELSRFPIGGVGIDADYSIAVAATTDGVVRYQTRPGIRRCDGKPALLFPEGFVAGTRKWGKIVPPSNLDANAQALTAKVDPDKSLPLLYQARAASHQPGQTDAGGLGLPRELDDGKLDTAWREELGSDGRGQFFTFEPRSPGIEARQIRIVNGNHSTAAALKATNRVREIGIVTEKGTWRVELPDPANAPLGTAHVIELPLPIKGCVSIVIDSTYGPKTGQTAITSLEVYAEGERAGGGDAMLARMLAEGKVDTTNVSATLGRRGPAGVLAIEGELGKTTDPGARRRLVGALVRITDPSAMQTLAKAARSGWVHDRDLLAVIRALAAGGQSQALRDLAKQNLDLDHRLAAVAGISATTPEGFDALVELAGAGPRPVRHAVIEQLATAPADSLAKTATMVNVPALAGDLWRALTRHARTHPDARAAALAAMVAALPATTDYERRYRLVDGIATLGDAAALQLLDTYLQKLPANVQTSALRQVAIQGLASAPRPEGVSLVLAFARDPDPGVRLATLAALAFSEHDAGGTWHGPDGPASIDRVIVNSLAASEPWPEVRRRAAVALGARCQRTGPANALLAAVDRDRSLDVRKDALTALVECRWSGIRELLPVIWNNGKAPPKMREHAITVVTMLGDSALAAQLVAKLPRWRAEALDNAASITLAKTAMGVIGRLAPAGAADALMDALNDSAYPEIVAAAAHALGALGKRCPAEAKRALESLATGGDQTIGPAASIAARNCGR